MIYKREEYVEEGDENSKFPVRHVEALIPVGEGKTVYVGQVTLGLQTPMGIQQIPLSFEIEAASAVEAFSKFDQAAEPRVEEARRSIEEEIQRLRTESARRIVRPDELGMGGGLGGGPVGGAGAGGLGGNVFPFKPKK